MPLEESKPLPPGDPNAELARGIGEGRALSNEDAFERALSSYRRGSRLLAPPPGLRDRVWAKIAPSRNMGPLRLVPSWARWAAAAAAIIVAIGFWVVYLRGPALVSASSASIVNVTLDDGSKITLRPHSSLYRTNPNAYRLDGEAFFDIAQDPQRTFQVETDLGRVRVLGTRFDVSTWGGETLVFLERGNVAFAHLPSGGVDTLAAGDQLLATSDGFSVEKAENGGESALDWMSQALVFGSRPLSRIVAEMEHHFDITVLVPDALKTETLSGQIYLSSPRQSLRDLGIALGGRFEETRPNVFRLARD